MDTCVGCRIVKYLFIVEYIFYCVLALGRRRGCVLSTIININRPDGATYSQTDYVRKYSPRARVVSAIVGN